MKLQSPAKINLFLKILGKRPDGFHELKTLMCPIDLCDEIAFELCDSEIEIEVEGADLSAGPDNLAYRAADLLRSHARIIRGVRIKIHKRIPLGGGLAGGSSNAAMVLRGCNELWDTGLSKEELHGLAAQLGSDVNLFIEDGPCLCRGRGELVEPVTIEGAYHVLLVNPGFGVSTPETFKYFAKLSEGQKKGTLGEGVYRYQNSSKIPFEFRLCNDLERAVFPKHLWITEAKRWLAGQEETLDSLMSGSGATLFALTNDPDKANSLQKKAVEYFGEETMIIQAQLLR
ncbi:MAG: 4-(cytidine 5'-diphospho)-2-C-methyl-D-erythritol kinase [Verrucomicrobiota bacterium]